jgi:hypothetical protein
VPEEMQAGLACKETAADAWEAIETGRMGGERIKEATVDKLHRDFDDPQFKAGECVEDFAQRATTIANKEVIKKILHSIPDHLEQVTISIETLLDMNSMSIEVAMGHLRAVEERKKKTSGGAKEGRLLLTEEEWMTHLKVREGEGSGGGCGRRGRGRGKCDGHGGGRGRGPPTDSNEEASRHAKPTDV